jgi:hypothetical protein
VLSGCRAERVDLGPFAQISGRVTFRSEPVTKGMITFHCLDSGQVATVQLRADGSYQMQLDGRPGLPVGHYMVCVRPPLPDSMASTKLRPGNTELEDEAGEGPDIPLKYHYESTSGLTAEVMAGENWFDFELADEE